MSSMVFFVDPKWRRDAEHVPLLYPFWGNAFAANLSLTRKVFDSYGYNRAYYGVTDNIAMADAILLPYRIDRIRARFPGILTDAMRCADIHRKKIVVDAIGDREHSETDPRMIILRYGGYRFLKKPNEVIVPLFADDLLERHCGGNISIREKHEVPVVGFVGWAELSPYQTARTFIKEVPVRLRGMVGAQYRACKKGVFFRRHALSVLTHSPLIVSNVIVRSSYSGNVKTAADTLEALRATFVENAHSSDFGLDVRGDANDTTRLYEYLSLGRVPLILDTERNFPFSDELDYRSFAIVVDFRDIDRLPEIVRAAYDAIAPDEWIAMQKRAREAYRNWMRPDAQTSHLVKRIRALLAR